MKTPRIHFLVAIVAIVFATAATSLLAEGLDVVKQRMAQRLSPIDAMKDRGVVGENNRGYLEARGALAADETGVVSAENADRTIVYAALAQREGFSADQISRRRAKQIAQNSKPGVWLEDESGRWYRK